MHYMGINDLEDYVEYRLNQFYRAHGNRKIIKILMPTKMYASIVQIAKEKIGYSYVLPEEKKRPSTVYWNNIPIEFDNKLKDFIIVPEGTLAESIYD